MIVLLLIPDARLSACQMTVVEFEKFIESADGFGSGFLVCKKQISTKTSLGNHRHQIC